ncbi:hypothetical protein EGJ34_21815, partial [Stenotrophomonas sp. 278]
MPWSVAVTAAGSSRTPWNEVMPQQRVGRSMGWVAQDRERTGLTLRWGSAALLGAAWELPYGSLPAVARELGLRWARPRLTRQAHGLR